MTDEEKSVRRLVNDANLRLAGLVFPHQSIGDEGAYLDEHLFEGPADSPLFAGGINIQEPRDNTQARQEDVEGDAQAKRK